MEKEYVRVPKADWLSILDMTRAKSGYADAMVSGEVAEKIEGIQTGGNSGNTAAIILGTVAETVGLRGYEVSTAEEKYYLFFEYNGVRLPRVPDNLLATYPYCWIALNNTNADYILILSSYPWYYTSSGLKIQSSKYAWYKAYADSTEWVLEETYTDTGGFTLSNGLTWTNHDIKKGSVSGTEIYFATTEPVPVD